MTQPDTPERLDTRGHVMDVGGTHHMHSTCWEDLSPFEQGYIEAMFVSFDSENGQPILISKPTGKIGSGLAHYVGFSDLAAETLATIRKDCAEALLDVFIAPKGVELGGQIFWRERQADKWLAFPPLHPTLSDGRIRFQ
jgi:hypothetical protein